ncbi:MAG: hypothetical protein KF846_00045 [Cyclobacteriaceae bacterium]|nr:hypothetical protein [Cyclobacteriaceae bacterium]
MRILFTAFFVVSIFWGCIAQSITDKKTTWSSVTLTDISNNSTIDLNSQFILDHNQTIKWVQRGGELTYTFDITNVSGQWSNTDEPGSIDCTVTINGLTGNIEFYRNNNGLEIKTNINRAGVNDMPFIFIISKVQINIP